MPVIDHLVARARRRLGFRSQPRWLDRAYPRYRIGAHSYGELAITDFGDGTGFTMGRYCSTARGSQVLLGGGHRVDWVTTYPFNVLEAGLADVTGHPSSRGDVIIGSDVWLATEAMVLSGVTIGDGAAVMARAVVTRDVPPYAIVGGIPARVIGYRFDPDLIARLLALAWWDWPHERVVAAGRALMSGNVAGFLDRAEAGAL